MARRSIEGLYDDFEVESVKSGGMNTKSRQRDLASAPRTCRSRLLPPLHDAQERLRIAVGQNDAKGAPSTG